MSKKETLFLPNTSYSMRADLPNLEKNILNFWEEINLKEKIFSKEKNIENKKKKFICHFGPPYANGELHLGHFFNQNIKDFAVRSASLVGKKVYNKAGFDCHGLPIELAVQKQLNISKDNSINMINFRKSCMDFADKWIEKQLEQMKRMGILIEKDYYVTYKNTKEIYEIFSNFLLKGFVYLAQKPVYWSITEKTTIAEAEVEYREKESTSLDLALQIIESPIKNLIGCYVCVWTTTPWSLMDNCAVAFNKDAEYFYCEVGQKVFLVSKEAFEKWVERLGLREEEYSVHGSIPGATFIGSKYAHPFTNEPKPMVNGDCVEIAEGTGFLHVAPAHGPEDYNLFLQFSGTDLAIEIKESIDDAGFFKKGSVLSGLHVFTDEEILLEKLIGKILAKNKIKHSYPYSSRGNIPLLYRSTEQIFINIDFIKEKLINLIEVTDWYPPAFKGTILSFLSSRKEWCVSRNRTWGVPLCLFINKKDGSLLVNEFVQQKILEKMATDVDFFFDESCVSILEGIVNSKDYRPYIGILDVWFDSGCSFEYVLKKEGFFREDVFYIEGKDQARGWFQSSGIISAILYGKFPYCGVITHGYITDDKAEKLSKSKGNAKSLNELIDINGVEVLRIWIAMSDFFGDVVFGEGVLELARNHYQKIRKLMRFLIAVTEGFSLPEDLKTVKFSEFDLAALEELTLGKFDFLKDISVFKFKDAFLVLMKMINSFSAGYLDWQKDILYCNSENSSEKIAVKTTVSIILRNLLVMLRVFLPFTSEEIFLYIKNRKNLFNQSESVHLETLDNYNFLGVKFSEIENVLHEDYKVRFLDLKKSGKILDFGNFIAYFGIFNNFDDDLILNVLSIGSKNYRDIKKVVDILHPFRVEINTLKHNNQISRNSDVILYLNDFQSINPEIFRRILGASEIFQSETSCIQISESLVCERCWRRLGNNICERCHSVLTENFVK